MKFSVSLIVFLMASSLSFSASARPEQCSVELESEVAVSDKIIRLRREDTDVVLTRDNRVYVNYEEVNISAEQARHVDAYSQQLRKTVPEIVGIALEGVEIGIAALTEVAYGMFESEPPKALLDAIDDINAAVAESVRHENGEYFVSGDRVGNVDEAIATVEPQLEKAITASIGAVFSDIGRIFESGGDVTVNLGSMAKRMENMSARIEQRVEEKAASLEPRAVALCGELESLAKKEQALHEAIPVLKGHSFVKRAG